MNPAIAAALGGVVGAIASHLLFDYKPRPPDLSPETLIRVHECREDNGRAHISTDLSKVTWVVCMGKKKELWRDRSIGL